MDHPDFRVGGKIFATLGHPAAGWGMVKLTLSQQTLFALADPDVFVPVAGGWGRRGATSVRLRGAKADTVRRALEAAWRNVGGGSPTPVLRLQQPSEFALGAVVGGAAGLCGGLDPNLVARAIAQRFDDPRAPAGLMGLGLRENPIVPPAQLELFRQMGPCSKQTSSYILVRSASRSVL